MKRMLMYAVYSFAYDVTYIHGHTHPHTPTHTDTHTHTHPQTHTHTHRHTQTHTHTHTHTHAHPCALNTVHTHLVKSHTGLQSVGLREDRGQVLGFRISRR